MLELPDAAQFAEPQDIMQGNVLRTAESTTEEQSSICIQLLKRI
jgi:hypothetical protein